MRLIKEFKENLGTAPDKIGWGLFRLDQLNAGSIVAFAWRKMAHTFFGSLVSDLKSAKPIPIPDSCQVVDVFVDLPKSQMFSCQHS